MNWMEFHLVIGTIYSEVLNAIEFLYIPDFNNPFIVDWNYLKQVLNNKYSDQGVCVPNQFVQTVLDIGVSHEDIMIESSRKQQNQGLMESERANPPFMLFVLTNFGGSNSVSENKVSVQTPSGNKL